MGLKSLVFSFFLIFSQLSVGQVLDRTGTSVRMSLPAVNASAQNSSDALTLRGYRSVSIQVLHSAHSSTSTWEIQVSNDMGQSWDSLEGSSKTTSGASGSNAITIWPWSYAMLRVTVTSADSNPAARLNTLVLAKE